MESTGTLPRRRLGLNALWVLVFLAWRNLWRNRLRSLLTAGAMVVGLTLMIGYMALIDGLFRQMVGFATDIAIGHIQLHRQAYIDDQDLYAVLPLGLVEHLERTTPYLYAPRSYAAGLASAGDSSSGALLKGVEPGQEVEVTDLHRRLRRGTFDLRGSTPAYPHGPDGPAVPRYPVVVGFNLARNLRLDLGGELVLITQAADGSIGNGLFEVRGVLNSIDPAFDRMGVLMSLEAFNSLMVLDEGVHELAVRVPELEDLELARDEIAAAAQAWPGSAALTEDEGGPARVRTWRQINPDLSDMIASSQAAIYIVAAIVFVIAAMGVLNTMLMATYERRHELGILLALGMGRWAMMAMVLLEAFFLACFAGAAGSITGGALAWHLQVNGIDFSAWLPEGLDLMGVVLEPVYFGYTRPDHYAISLAMLVLTTLIAALLPSWRTARMNPVRALHE
jgi:ABC-type lipoprotein release transport system permease subunit